MNDDIDFNEDDLIIDDEELFKDLGIKPDVVKYQDVIELDEDKEVNYVDDLIDNPEIGRMKTVASVNYPVICVEGINLTNSDIMKGELSMIKKYGVENKKNTLPLVMKFKDELIKICDITLNFDSIMGILKLSFFKFYIFEDKDNVLEVNEAVLSSLALT